MLKFDPKKQYFFFSKMCTDMESEDTSLLQCCNLHWLNCNTIIPLIFEVRNKIHSFLVEENHDYAENFIDSAFLTKPFGYFSEIKFFSGRY